MSGMFALGTFQLKQDYDVYGWEYSQHVIVDNVDFYEVVSLKQNLVAIMFILFIDLLLVLGTYYALVYYS